MLVNTQVPRSQPSRGQKQPSPPTPALGQALQVEKGQDMEEARVRVRAVGSGSFPQQGPGLTGLRNLHMREASVRCEGHLGGRLQRPGCWWGRGEEAEGVGVLSSEGLEPPGSREQGSHVVGPEVCCS